MRGTARGNRDALRCAQWQRGGSSEGEHGGELAISNCGEGGKKIGEEKDDGGDGGGRGLEGWQGEARVKWSMVGDDLGGQWRFWLF